MKNDGPTVSTTAIQHHVRFAVDRLIRAKDLLGYVAIGVAIAYGVGWSIRHGVLAAYGVGPVSVPHESAIATTIALTVALLPPAVLGLWIDWAYRNQQGNLLKYWILQVGLGTFAFCFVGFVVLWLPLALAEADAELKMSCLLLLCGQWLFTMCLMIAFIVAKTRFLAGPIVIFILAVTCARMFAFTLLPRLPEALGGIGHSSIEITLCDPGETAVGRLIATDDQALVLSQVTILRAGVTPQSITSLKLPWSRVVDIRTPTTGRNTTSSSLSK